MGFNLTALNLGPSTPSYTTDSTHGVMKKSHKTARSQLSVKVMQKCHYFGWYLDFLLT